TGVQTCALPISSQGATRLRVHSGLDLLCLDSLFWLRLVTLMRFSDKFTAPLQPFEYRGLLRMGQQAIQTGSQVQSLIIIQLVAHLLNHDQNRASGAIAIATAVRHLVCAVQ